MRTLQKILLLLTMNFLAACDSSEASSLSKIESSSYSIKYEYDLVEDKFILYSNIFGVNKDEYYVYFFSRTCSHCQSIKSFIIEKALEREDIYFVESSKEVVFINDVAKTIGLTSIDGFGILGYPSLVKIKEKTIQKNIAGTQAIRNELLN